MLRGLEPSSCVPDAIAATRLQEKAFDVIDTLSRGYKQRVGIAQAIIHKPALLILDEPIQGLDPVQIVEMRELIRSLRGEHTILLSSHILSEIEAVCDRVVILIQGELAADATLEELMSAEELRLTVSGPKSAQQVMKRLKKLEGVAELSELSSAEGRYSFSVTPSAHEETGAQAEALTALAERLHKEASEAGWSISHLARYEQSLEEIFRDLMRQHVSRQRAASDAKEAS